MKTRQNLLQWMLLQLLMCISLTRSWWDTTHGTTSNTIIQVLSEKVWHQILILKGVTWLCCLKKFAWSQLDLMTQTQPSFAKRRQSRDENILLSNKRVIWPLWHSFIRMMLMWRHIESSLKCKSAWLSQSTWYRGFTNTTKTCVACKTT